MDTASLRLKAAAIALAFAVLIGGMAITGCSNGTARSLTALAENSVEALVLNASAGQLVEIAYDVDPDLGTVVEMGVFALAEVGNEVRKAKTAAPNSTFLIVQQVIGGATKDTIYKITTRQTLVVALNGQFVETISLNSITVKVVPGTDSTIIVTAKDPKNIVYRSGTFNASQLPFDLDDGIGGAGQLSGGRHAEINRHFELLEASYELITLNGTESAPWRGSQLPTLANCASLPTSDWNTTMIAEQNWGWTKNGTAWCVHTPAGHYGAVVVNGSLFDYLLWKTPNEA